MITEDLITNKSCPLCANSSLMVDSINGEIVCTRCGCIVKERAESFDVEHISRDREDYLKNTRASKTSPLESKYGVSATRIGTSNTDYAGRVLDTQSQDTVVRLRKLETKILVRALNKKSLRFIHTELNKVKDKLSLNDQIIEDALRLYLKCVERNLDIGRHRLPLLAAAIYLACKISGVVRSISEISSALNIKERFVFRYYLLLTTNMNIQAPLTDIFTDISKWVVRIANKMGLDEVTKRLALHFLELLKKKNFMTSRKPISVAAALIYLACYISDKPIVQADVAEIADISIITLRCSYIDIKETLGLWNLP